MKFEDAQKFPQINYSVNVSWRFFPTWIKNELEEGLQMNPDFQRGHVWKPKQKTAYIEFVLSGGKSGLNLYFNHPGWMSSFEGEFVLVDGLQRATAVLEFLENKVKAFGLYCNEFEDKVPHDIGFTVNVAQIKERKDVLGWYLLMNEGGTPHSKQELNRVRGLMEDS